MNEPPTAQRYDPPVHRWLHLVLLTTLLLAGCGRGDSAVAVNSGMEWVSIPEAGYSLARTEVTVAQYAACAAAGACSMYKLEGIEWKERPWAPHEDCAWGRRDTITDVPINCIDWHQADEVCRWAGGRLPTKDEWVREASAGGTRVYPWGDQPPTCAEAVMDDWQNAGGFADRRGCGTQGTWPVCSKPAGRSLHGLCDMAGNVTEWTSTQELTQTPPRFNMGGSYTNSGTFLQARFELINPTAYRIHSLGARCLKPD